MATLNLGILAHVDAGKTSLTERLLHTAGVIDELGSVDDGSTRTDTLDLERRRGITIKSAVVSFPLAGTTVNLIDTPGHPDFIAEVERVLDVLDGAVLVISAVEGVQAQTIILSRTLHRLRIPTLIFVNKTDRAGARHADLLDEIAARVSGRLVPMNGPVNLGSETATKRRPEPGSEAAVKRRPEPGATGHIAGGPDLWRLAEYDDTVLTALVEGRPVAPPMAGGQLHPVYFGSAITGAGIDDLITGITTQLPAAHGDPGNSLAATVFKVDRGARGEKIAYLRMADGTLRVRDTLGKDRVTGIDLFTDGGRQTTAQLTAGQIGAIHGLTSVRIGDTFGVRAEPIKRAEPFIPGQAHQPHFAPPALETEVLASSAAERPALHAALAELAEADPLIGLRREGARMFVSLYGEVQKEVIESTLAEQYGLAVTFRETTTLHIERPVGVGEAVEFNKVEPNEYLATVGLRVEPAAEGETTFSLAVEPGSMPAAFFKAVEETVRATLRRGPRGWPVDAIAVTMTHSGYSARQSHAHAVFDKSMSSTAGDFRNLTPRVLMAALGRAGTRVLEPVHAFLVEFPPDTLPALLPELARLRAVALDTTPGVIEGEIPAARVRDLRRRLPGLTRGEGVLDVNVGSTKWLPSTPG